MVAGAGCSIVCGKTLGRRLVPAFLHQNVNGVSVLVGGPSKIMEFAADLDEHLVQIPGVTQSALSLLKLSRIFRPESVAALPNGFIRDRNSTFGQKIFHIPKAQTEAMIQPNCVTDDGRRKSVATV
jgi:hypothetical protein